MSSQELANATALADADVEAYFCALAVMPVSDFEGSDRRSLGIGCRQQEER